MVLIIVMIISFIIIAVVMGLAIITTNKAYGYVHKVDKLPETIDDKDNLDEKQNN